MFASALNTSRNLLRLTSAFLGVCTIVNAAIPVIPHHDFLTVRANGQGSSKCASEGSACSCDGIVAYGANGNYFFKKTNGQEDISCSNDVFGDPLVNVHKDCYCTAPAQVQHAQCASEWGTCACDGTVAYGADDKYFFKKTNGKEEVRCTNEIFGDPIYGTVKSCSCFTVTPIIDQFRADAEDWTPCAETGEECQCNGEVRLGHSIQSRDYISEFYTYKPVSGSITCDMSNFMNADVIPSGLVRPPCSCRSAGWTRCAGKDETCECASKTVRLIGAEQHVSSGSDSLACSASSFPEYVGALPDSAACECYAGAFNPQKEYVRCGIDGDACRGCPDGSDVVYGSGIEGLQPTIVARKPYPAGEFLILCNDEEFGVDFAPFVKRSCFCEISPSTLAAS